MNPPNYIFLLQLDKKYFILDMIEEVETHKSRSHWTLMENIEVKNKHKNKEWKLKTILSILSFKHKILLFVRLIKHKTGLCEHGGMKQWGVKYWKNYAPVVNSISVRSLLDIACTH